MTSERIEPLFDASEHNHHTRGDHLKPPGRCPACDAIRASENDPLNHPPLDDRIAFAIDACKAAEIDPYPIMADELRKNGFIVTEPPSDAPFPGPHYHLCEDSDCSDAYAYRAPFPEVKHWHYIGSSDQ